MFKKLSLIILIASITIAIFNSCEKGTEPEIPKIKPGRRDYVWTEDTLDVGKNGWISYKDMTGYASNDVWLGTLGMQAIMLNCGTIMALNGNQFPFPDMNRQRFCFLKIIHYGLGHKMTIYGRERMELGPNLTNLN